MQLDIKLCTLRQRYRKVCAVPAATSDFGPAYVNNPGSHHSAQISFRFDSPQLGDGRINRCGDGVLIVVGLALLGQIVLLLL